MARWLLKELAEARGMTRYRVAKDAGLPYHTVTLVWKNKAKRLDMDTLTALARALDIAPGELIGEGEGPVEAPQVTQ